jgi:hypothetical protein
VPRGRREGNTRARQRSLQRGHVDLRKFRMPTPLPLPDDQLKLLSDALLQGRKIEAIKIYREATRLGLKEAKDAIEETEASLREKFPEKFAAVPKGKGCGGAAVLMGIVFAVVAYFVVRSA